MHDVNNKPGLDKPTAIRVVSRILRCTGDIDVDWEKLEEDACSECYAVSVISSDPGVGRYFLKSYARSPSPDDECEQRRVREMAVYEHVLARIDLGAPRYYGFDHDAHTNRYWMLQELIDGVPLGQCSLEFWHEAAAWLARMQAKLLHADCVEQVHDVLEHHTAPYFESRALRALAAVGKLAPQQLPHLERIVGQYIHRIVPAMVSVSGTLVHGSYRQGRHILVDTTAGAVRICPVDWEVAGLGSPLYDLAFLTDGFQGEQLDALIRSYCDEAIRQGLPLDRWPRVVQLVRCFQIHKILRSLSEAIERQFELSVIDKLVQQAAGLWEAVSGLKPRRTTLLRVLAGDSFEHEPALRAWRRLAPDQVSPDAIETLRQRSKSTIYRLRGATRNGSSVILKYLPGDESTEAFVYEKVLARMNIGVPGLLARDNQPGSTWLALEDVGSYRYSEQNPGHRQLVAHWLADLHAAARTISEDIGACLPDGGAARYLAHLQSARRSMGIRLAKIDGGSDAELLAELIEILDRLERQWDQVEQACVGVAPTLVHGDLQPKNGFVQRIGQYETLYVVDWETTGWGTPAKDLASVELEYYWQRLRQHYPSARFEPVARARAVGKMFGWLAEIDWRTLELVYNRPTKTFQRLTEYRPRFVASISGVMTDQGGSKGPVSRVCASSADGSPA